MPVTKGFKVLRSLLLQGHCILFQRQLLFSMHHIYTYILEVATFRIERKVELLIKHNQTSTTN